MPKSKEWSSTYLRMVGSELQRIKEETKPFHSIIVCACQYSFSCENSVIRDIQGLFEGARIAGHRWFTIGAMGGD